jgi:CheY-like chemotaxis protein
MSKDPTPIQVLQPVLIVEDDFELADLLSEVLTFENCLPEVATNGVEALDKLRTGHYVAVICDLMMPMMDGESLYLKVAEELPYLADRFVFITGQSSRRSGLTDFIFRTQNVLLEKPFEVDQFREALRGVLSR